MDFLRQLRRQDGIALVMAVGMLIVLTIAGTTALYYTTANQRTANLSKASSLAYSLAEAGMANALSVLNNALDPRTPSTLSTTTVTLEGGTATYSGTYNASTGVWTITSTGQMTNPSGVPVANAKRTLTRQVQIYGINSGATTSAWSRIYQDSTGSCLSIPVSIPSPVTSRGSICLTGSGKILRSTTSTTTKVSAGTNVTLAASSTIGASGANVAEVNVAGTCQFNGGTAHSPCQGPPANADKVWADTITTAPTDLSKPGVDFAYWYANAKPGPSQNCTTGSFPGGFDNDSTYNNSNGVVEMTPSTSYTCQVRDGGGNLLGELSWNATTNVLSVNGTIFIDGRLNFISDPGTLVNYQGKATLYAAGRINVDEKLCAGGSGSNNCRTAGMSSWDPLTNLLVLAVGDKELGGGDDIEFSDNDPADSAFQGVIWAKNDCDLNKSFWSSGPIICNVIRMESSVGFYSWPPLGNLMPGQVYGTVSTSPGTLVGTPGAQSG